MKEPTELLMLGGGVVFTGGLGWWAHYVTQGAAMARKLAGEVKHLEERSDEHIEEVKAVRQHIELLRRDVGNARADIAHVAGNLQGLIEFIHDGKSYRRTPDLPDTSGEDET